MKLKNVKLDSGKQSCSSLLGYGFSCAAYSQERLVKLMPSPAIGAVDDYSRFSCCFKYLQAVSKNLFLLRQVKCFTHGMAERIFQVVGAWRFDRLSHLSGNRNSYSRNALSFYFTLNQTDRLVAETSGGYQKGYINFLLLNFFCCINCAFLD